MIKNEEPSEINAICSPEQIIESALLIYQKSFDRTNGGFGHAPKFPSPHNLLFLMHYYEKTNHKPAMEMVEKTLLQMYRGGIFDHIGGGFSRYSTDDYFLAPHFEKMLYDNALLILAYAKAYKRTSILRLSHYYENAGYDTLAKQQLQFMITEATHYPSGYAMFLCVLLDYVESPTKITIVLKDKTDLEKLKGKAPLSTIVKISEEPTSEYPLINEQTTYYVCKGRSCQPATNTSPF